MRPWKACWIASLFLSLSSSFASQRPSSVLDSHRERKSVADEHYEIGLYFVEQGMSDTAIRDLMQHVHAVPVLFEHPLDARHLARNPAEPALGVVAFCCSHAESIYPHGVYANRAQA